MFKDWRVVSGILYGFTAIIAVTPLLGFGLVRIPLQPPEFVVRFVWLCVLFFWFGGWAVGLCVCRRGRHDTTPPPQKTPTKPKQPKNRSA